MVQVSEVVDYDSFLSLEREWNRLVERSTTDTVFVRHEWFNCWWQAYGNGKGMLVLLVRDGEQLLGICPLMTTDERFRIFPVRKIAFMANDEAPRCDLICADRHEEVVSAIVSYLKTRTAEWDVLHLQRVPNTSMNMALFSDAFKREGFQPFLRKSWTSPYLLINEDWVTFYKGTTQRFKKRMRNNLNRIKKANSHSIEHITNPEDLAALIGDIFTVGQQCWKAELGRAISSSPENREFFSKLAEIAANNGWLSLWLMKIDGRPVAFEFHLRYKGSAHALRSEFDQNFSDLSPGAVLDVQAVQTIFDEGMHLYDLGGSADEYKKHWTSEVQEHGDLVVFNRGAYQGVLRFVEGALVPCFKKVRSVVAGVSSSPKADNG